MRCPLLCKQKKEINGKWCLPCGYERHQQRNWLGSLLFNCLESVPLHPNTTPYYQKYAPNFRNNPRATRPHWLQEPEQARPQRANKLPTKLEPEPEIFKEKSTQTESDKYEHKKKESLREYHLIQPFLKQKNNKNFKISADDIITTFGTYRNREEYKKQKPIHKPSQRHLPQKHESKLAANQFIEDRYTLSTDKKKKQMVQERNLILQFCPQKNAKNIQSKEQPKTLNTKFGTYSQGSIEAQPKFTKKLAKMLQGTKVPEFNALLKSRHGLRVDAKQEAPALHRSNKINPFAQVPDTPVIQKKKIKAAPRDTEELKQAPLKSEPKQAPLRTEPKQAPLRTEPKQAPLRSEPKQIPLKTEPKRAPLKSEPKQATFKTEPKQTPLKSEVNIQPAFTKTFEKMLQDVNPEMPEQHRLLRSQHLLAIKGRDRRKRSAIDVVGIQPKFTATFDNMLKNTNANEPEEYKLIKSRYAIKRKANVKRKLIANAERKRSSVGSSLTRSKVSIIRKVKYRSFRRDKKNTIGSLDSFDVWNLKYLTQTKSHIPEKMFGNKEIHPRSSSAMISRSSSLANEEHEVTTPSPSVGYILPTQNAFKLSLYEPIRYPQPGEAQPKRVGIKRYSNRIRKFYNIRPRPSKSPSFLRNRKVDSPVGMAARNVEAEIDSTDQGDVKNKIDAQNSYSLYDFQSNLDINISRSGQWLLERRAQLAAQIAELMKLVEIREDVPLRKKRERNFVREAQTQLWKTKPPRIEKIAKKKRSKFPTKLEKLRFPSDTKTGSLKPLVIRRYRRKPELQPAKHRTECTCATCNTCKMFKLGKMEADTPLIREMKAKGRRMQLQNYYRLLSQREAWKRKGAAL